MSTGEYPQDQGRAPPAPAAASAPGAAEGSLAHVQQALNKLRYGTVTIIVQDGVVVQIDRTEKTRLR